MFIKLVRLGKDSTIRYTSSGKVAYAVKKGELVVESCEECDKDPAQAHHDDYLKPLNVRWLCCTCHNAWHKENGEALNP